LHDDEGQAGEGEEAGGLVGLPWQIIQGDVRAVLKTLDTNRFDAVLSDPPYGLSFMGKRWDYFLPSVNVWAELLRVLKPGAYAMLFGGSRTFHRLAVSVEDAGFELRDTLMWLYGQGFPKSHDVSKALDAKAGVVRRQIGTKKGNKNANGSGHGSAIPGARRIAVDVPVTLAASPAAIAWSGYGTALKPAFEPIVLARKQPEGSIADNALKWGTGAIAIDESRIGDEMMAVTRSTGEYNGRSQSMAAPLTKTEVVGEAAGRWPANVVLDAEAGAILDVRMPDASRFFYTPKPDRIERDAGNEARSNIHPTVKPIDLIRYFAKMILPPRGKGPRRILVPFSGSGSEMIGCLQAGWDEVVGIERESEYIAIAKQRIAKGGVFSQLQDRHMRRAAK